MTSKSSIIKPNMAKSEYLHQRIDSDLKKAASNVAEQRYGSNALTTLITAMLLADLQIKEEYYRLKEIDTLSEAIYEKDRKFYGPDRRVK